MGMSRSEQMSRIKGTHTAPERRLRTGLWTSGLRYRLHAKTPGGRPDLVFNRARVAVFIDGCFWHGCPLHYVRPRTRPDFWAEKLGANVDRDRRQTKLLEERGWIVLRFWEHEVVDSLEDVERQVVASVTHGERAVGPRWRVDRVTLLEARRDLERRFLVALEDESLRREEEGPRYGRSGPKPSSPKNPATGLDEATAVRAVGDGQGGQGQAHAPILNVSSN